MDKREEKQSKVVQIGIIADLYQKAKQRNMLGGIIISYLITFIAYVIFPAGIFWFGDFQMALGVAIGTRFSLKNLKEDQSPLKYGIITALGGSILTAISMSVFDWIIFSFDPTIEYSLGIILFSYLLEALIIGLVLGMILGLYFRSKYRDKVKQSKQNLDDLYESLKN